LSRFSGALSSGKFVVTCELNPPKGIDLNPLFEKALALDGPVDAFNLTDSAGSNLAMAPIGAARLLAEKGIETILQVACRDRNRLALQSELLAAGALGLPNVLCMTGDPPGRGDHPEAKAVFDIDAIDLLRAVSALASGHDFAGNELKGTPEVFAGAVVNPGAPDLDKELARMEDKVKAGASFFQSQAVYDPGHFEKFMVRARGFGVPVLAGMIVLKSAKMARNLDANLPGVSVPQPIIDEMENADDRAVASIRITAELISQVKSLCEGVHIMAIGWESRVPAILAAAGLSGQE
jgi:5,10-methylenetetrahydrofolate reductase